MATNTHKESSSSVVGLFTGVLHYLKGLKFLDTLLPRASKSPAVISEPPKKTDTPNDTTATIPTTTTTTTDDDETNTHDTDRPLFPKKIFIDNDAFKESTAVPCATNQPSKLVKVDNLDGSVSWSFDHSAIATNNNNNNMTSFSTMTSPFLTSTGSTASGGFSPLVNINMFTGHKDSPSPLAMEQHRSKILSTHTSDMDSTNSLEEDLAKIPDLPNPEFFNIGLTNGHNDDDDDGEREEEDDEDEGDASDAESDASIDHKTGKKKTKSYICEFCGAEFRIRGYLTRHVKKHALNKAYECPFFDDHSENKCHPNGGFSRRDTYKTHLKARHFKYPPGTRSQDRAITAGKCGLCNKPYESNEDWVEKHIEGGECEALPKGYTGRVKNSRRKNYEYPNPQQISPISSNSGNDSPMTSKSSPHNLVLTQQLLQHHHLTTATQDTILPQHTHDSISGVVIGGGGIAHMTPGSMSTTPVNHSINSRSGSTDSNQVNVNGVNNGSMLPINHMKFNGGAVHFSDYNDYDNNDEFSLDMEQCMSFTPIVTGEYSY